MVRAAHTGSLRRTLGRRRLGFLGAGKMGQALLRGMLAEGLSPRQLIAADPSPEARRALRRLRIHTVEPGELAAACPVVVLAVKPQQMADVLVPLAERLGSGHLVMSIAAGLTLGWLRERLPRARLVRAMPNLPATVRCGFTALACSPGAAAADRRTALAIFGSVGPVVELPEQHFDAITALSGSGPAYVFYLAQALQEAGRDLGLPAAVVNEAVLQTLKGSVRLLEESGISAEALIGRVASKGGTTEAALATLEGGRVRQRVVEALAAAAARSRELTCR